MASRPPENGPTDELARKRWMALQAIRIGGFFFVILGILMSQGVLDIAGENNRLIGSLFVVVGLLDGFFMPIFLARKWRSPDR